MKRDWFPIAYAIVYLTAFTVAVLDLLDWPYVVRQFFNLPY